MGKHMISKNFESNVLTLLYSLKSFERSLPHIYQLLKNQNRKLSQYARNENLKQKTKFEQLARYWVKNNLPNYAKILSILNSKLISFLNGELNFVCFRFKV